MYPKLILRNVFRNIQTYTIYFFSLALIYSLLYAFNALPSHPVMQSLSGSKEMMTTIMSQYMGLLSYLILAAVAFLVIYSTNFVLGRRKKELGLYATLGMKKHNIIGTLFFETMLVNVFALFIGFALGLVLLIILAHIAAEFFMANYFGNLFFLDMKSVTLLVYSYIGTTVIVGVMDILTFKKQNIIALIQDNGIQKSVLAKGNPTSQIFVFVVSTLVIITGAIYLSNYQHLSILKDWGILLVSVFVFFVIVFYNSLSHFLLGVLQSIPSSYFKKLNTFKIRQFSKQADKNSVTLAVLSLTLTLALSLLVFSGSAYTSMNNDLNRFLPYDIDIQKFEGEGYHYNHTTIKKQLKKDGFDVSVIDKEFEYPIYVSALTYKDIIDTNHLWSLDAGLGDSFVKILSISDYNKLMRIQGKNGVSLEGDEFLVNSNYKGTISQVKEFLESKREVTIGNTKLKPASINPLNNVYFVTTVENNDRGTLIVPDKVATTLKVQSRHYIGLYKERTDKRKIETFLNKWVEQYYFTDQNGDNSDFVYQTKVRASELYIGVMGVIVLVMLFVSAIFIIISLSILSLQTSTSALDSVRDYHILYLLGNKREQNKVILIQQIMSYFIVPLLVAIPLSISLSKALLGYFENFANTTVIIDIKYLSVAVLLFVTYSVVTYIVSWQIVDAN
ncbi:TPA: ABC transporter permease [Streptococcus suis]|nr:ABC transporter permease [Streptococcus suis]